jgi:hypothetical protein
VFSGASRGDSLCGMLSTGRTDADYVHISMFEDLALTQTPYTEVGFELLEA